MCSSKGQAPFHVLLDVILSHWGKPFHSMNEDLTRSAALHGMIQKIRTRAVSYFKANFNTKLQHSKEIFFDLISSLKLLCRVLAYGVQQTSFDGHWIPFAKVHREGHAQSFSAPKEEHRASISQKDQFISLSTVWFKTSERAKNCLLQ